MHFAAFLDVGESVREPAQLLPQQRRRRAERARGDGGGVGRRCSCSRRPARPTASRSRRRSPRPIRSSPINSYGETKLAVERALPHFERAYGMRSMALRYFNAAGADPDGEIGEDHSPGDPPDSARHRRRAPAGRGCRCSATTTRRPTAPACATTSTSPTSPTRTSRRSRRSPRRGAPPPTISAPARRIRCGR